MTYYISNDYLAHHGVKGMHWGIRRYRNADGSLTNAGRKRYYREIKKSYNKQKDPSRPFLISKETEKIIRSNISKSKILESDGIKGGHKRVEKTQK